MPSKLMECVSKGNKGWKAEGGGSCFVGAGAREKAVAQMTAINISTAKKEGKAWAEKLPPASKSDGCKDKK